MIDRRRLLELAALFPTLLASAAFKKAPRKVPPNFIHICADDFRVDDLRVMPNLFELLHRKGVKFENHFAAYSLCAPSRVGMLTGLQPQNHGVYRDKPPQGGYAAYKPLEDNALPVWLSEAGYHVGHIGKFINDYENTDPLHVPPGYADWQAMASDPSYTNFTLNENGTLVEYKDAYSTDLFFQKLITFLDTAPEPFANFFWPNCVHWPAIPAAADLGSFNGVAMPKPDNFNEADVSDKPGYVRRKHLLKPHDMHRLKVKYHRRAECLQSFDRGIAAMIAALIQSGRLDNTHVIFTSDNGLLEGEHRMMEEKNMLYEESARVPLIWLRAIGHNLPVTRPVLNIDVTATIVELAEAGAGRVLDGRSLLPLLRDADAEWVKAVVIQCAQAIGLATEDYRYADWRETGEKEVYDMTIDPYQLENKAGLEAYAGIQAALAAALDALKDCSGDSCAWNGDFPPPPGTFTHSGR